ncbi:MAG: amidohydrolase family protein [Bryobacterales bacterium]|nr:amidohydrolase family protein [Bryobacterales bacterium]
MSHEAPWPVLDHDLEFFRQELDSFLPARLFDAHNHLYRNADFTAAVPPLAASGPAVVDWPLVLERMREILPGRRFAALSFPYPAVGLDTAAANEFLAAECRQHPATLGQMVVTPAMDPEFVRETVRRHRFVGLKCYHLFSPRTPTWDSAVEEYMPEAQVKVAHEEGLSITLHMVRARALSDPVNQHSIRRLAEKYPNARWILAHAARGFNVHHTIGGIASLRGLKNIWFDTSAVTEAGAFEAIVREFGASRILYGADFPVTHMRGRCVALGDSFIWLTPENLRLNAAYSNIRPVLVMLESLRAHKQAAWNLNLSDGDLEKMFWDNAAELYGYRENAHAAQ